jgi:lipoprotein-releasing system ATP-binding protein
MAEVTIPLAEAVAVSRILGKQLQTSVLHEVSFQVVSGEFIALTGPSGSGKTTLLYLLGALDRPSSGEIRIQGQSTTHLHEAEMTRLRQQTIGFIFQFHFLLPEFSALDNVVIPQVLAGVSRHQAEQRARELLGRTGLGHRLRHRPAELSGGEQQRVAIARALSNRPALILADEPTGNLDSENTEQVFALLKQLNREENLAVVCVTHNLELAARMDRLIQMRDGRVVKDQGGRPDRPAALF